MEFFAPGRSSYFDATLGIGGVLDSREQLRGMMAQAMAMAMWADGPIRCDAPARAPE
ncbi:hypothetical protein [Streptomyces sp. Y7]|uniref:hypothetical protein n=1 Tax=Streptomyces sp. Y7 TaxID=3342392 RepID=UPI00371204D9